MAKSKVISLNSKRVIINPVDCNGNEARGLLLYNLETALTAVNNDHKHISRAILEYLIDILEESLSDDAGVDHER